MYQEYPLLLNNLGYADDIVVIAGNEMQLQEIIHINATES